MNAVEKTLLENMENKKFQDAISDDFAFADSLIDQNDINKYTNEKEAKKDGCND